MRDDEIKNSKKKKKRKLIIGIIIAIIFVLVIFGIRVFAYVNEHDFSRNITINLNGGSADMEYYSCVDKDGCGHNGGDWFSGLGIGDTFKDNVDIDHTISGFADCESPREGTFFQHCDFVGVTPYVRISTTSQTYYNFTGWSTDTYSFESDGYFYFKVGCYANGSGDINITANWSPWQHTVIYDANGGSGAPGNQTKTYGVAMNVSSTQPFRLGYTFGGWSCSLGGTFNASDNYTHDQNDGTVTMKAIWNACEHTITYDANGGSGAPADQIKKYGEHLFLRKEKPTRIGYSFLGWSCSIGGTYKPGDEYTHDQNGGKVIMKAIWSDNIAPLISELKAEPNTWSSGNGTISVTALDQGSGINKIELKRKSLVTNVTATVKTWYHFGTKQEVKDTYTEVNEGVYVYTVIVTDVAGNSSQKTSSVIYLDHSNPNLSLKNTVESEWTNIAPVIEFSASDYLSGTAYSGSGLASIDIEDDNGKVVESGTETAKYTVTTDYEGIHSWYITATDNVGHTSSKSVTTKYDCTKPGIDGTEITYVRSDGVTVSGYCQDNMIEQYIDDEASRSVNSPNVTSGIRSVILYRVTGASRTVIYSDSTKVIFNTSNTHSCFDMYYEISADEKQASYYEIIVMDFAGNRTTKRLTSQYSLLSWFHSSIDRSSYE